MGSAQGVVTIANGVGDIALRVGDSMPLVGGVMGAYVGELITQQMTPNYGTYWIFGILLAIAGLMLIGRGDRKPRDPRDKEPLLSEPLYERPPPEAQMS